MIALQMYTLREFMKTPAALAETLRRVRAMGYECVQITPPAFTDASELAALLRSCGLRADSAICPLAQIPERIDQIARDATGAGNRCAAHRFHRRGGSLLCRGIPPRGGAPEPVRQAGKGKGSALYVPFSRL